MKTAFPHFDPSRSGKASRLVEPPHWLDDRRPGNSRRTLHTGPNIQRHHNRLLWRKLKPFRDPQSHRLSIPHGNGHKISCFKGLFAFGANHIFPAPDPVHGGPTITPLKDWNPYRGLHSDRQTAFQLATGPALVHSHFHAHRGFRMGYKGRLCLWAIDTRQNTFPLHIGFHRGHEAHTGKKLFFMAAFWASIHIPFTHTGSPPLNFSIAYLTKRRNPGS